MAKAMMRSSLLHWATCITIDVLETSIAMGFVVELAGFAARVQKKARGNALPCALPENGAPTDQRIWLHRSTTGAGG